jgi:hypothetical protein
MLLAMPWAGDAGASGDVERLHDTAAGISLIKPAGWTTASAQDIERNRERVRLPDSELQRAMQEGATAPLLVFMKYPESHDELNPSVQVVLRPLGPLVGATPTQILEAAIGPLEQVFYDFEFVQRARETTVDGLPAAYMVAKYSIANTDGATFATLSRLWVVPRGGLMFMIGMNGPQEGGDVSAAEFEAVLDSIEIAE